MTEAKGDATTPPAKAPPVDDFDMESAAEASSLSKIGLALGGGLLLLLILVAFFNGPSDTADQVYADTEVPAADAIAADAMAADAMAEAAGAASASAAAAEAAASAAEVAPAEAAGAAIYAFTVVYAPEFPDLAAACNASPTSEAGDQCVNLGIKFERGNGIAKDIPRATKIYEVGCAKGSMTSCVNAGLHFGEDGASLQNRKRSFDFLTRACDAGNMFGCAELGYNYENGVGVASDKVRARQLYDWACNKGWNKGCDYRATLDSTGYYLPK